MCNFRERNIPEERRSDFYNLCYILVREYNDVKIPTTVWQLINVFLISSHWMTVLMTWLWIGQGRFLRICSPTKYFTLDVFQNSFRGTWLRQTSQQ
jgi:hypothetical protein